jgi:flagellar biosynthetic protein FliR
MPLSFAGLEAQLWLWMVAMIRPGAAFLAAPVFGAATVPVQVRLVLALAIGIPSLAATPFMLPDGGIGSVEGVLLIVSETLIGLALGFAVQIGYSAALLGGEVISNAMGLGFAAMVDPSTGASNPAIAQFLAILATFLFLATNGHLALAATIIDSYRALPPGQAWLAAASIRGLVDFGGILFSAGLTIALPVAFAVLLVQIVMGMLARAAPALNLFAVGMPAALLSGVVLLAMAAPVIGEGITSAIQAGIEQAQRMVTG